MSANPTRELLERICAAVDDPRPAPAVVVLVAHPDDEVLGTGSRLPRLQRALFVHVTDGAPRNMRDAVAAGFACREEYAAARRDELFTALGLAGIGPEQCLTLGFADQESSLNLPGLVRGVTDLLGEIRPEVVMTHPYEGGHPDHDATALAVHAASRLLMRRGVAPPAIVEMASYQNGTGKMTPGEFLPRGEGDEFTLVLTKQERSLKRRLIECYRTQHRVLRQFPLDVERFRPAPQYDFTRPPHAGRLFYEHYDWGMTGPRWRRLASEALEALRLRGASLQETQ